MESFRNIADETFPSFLGSSLNSSASVLVENVTISSNPGLPVAASTVAKNKIGPDSRVNGMFSFVSIDDDIDDEEFFDNQLEAYFEQLIPPDMTRGDNDIGKLSECCAALKLSENDLLQVSLKWSSKLRIPHSSETCVVYQNEEGKWVTDLAYYTSFDEEQDLNLSEDDKINEFITGSEAAAMIAQDQEEFEKTHRLLQVSNDLNANRITPVYLQITTSVTSFKDASYLRLSLGEFFGQRSEALGCLGGGSDVKRPSFGYHITSPKTRQPVALLRQFDASIGDATQEISQFSEGGVNEDKLEGGLSNHSDSVLSISTIASAIANASCSAEPSQLAAMMMTLSNKNRKKRFLPGIVKETELTADRASSSNVENITFDMEKYLKKTDESGHESERESIAKREAPVQNSMSESTLLAKVRNKETLVEDFLSDHNEQQLTEKQFLSYFNSENASELSTTIIRASPTPSQEQTNKLEDYLCQRNRKGVQFSVDQKSKENELAHPERKLEGQGQELSKEDLPKNERQLGSAASRVAATLKELEPALSALASKFCVFQPLPVNTGAQEVWQDHTNKAQTQGLPSLNTLPVYPGLRACIPVNQNTPGEQYIPISSFKSHVTTSESQTVSSVPTLLPGHSLATTQFAQHHLGNVPSTGNKILPQFHGCSSAGFSVPPSGLPYSSISAELVENSVPVGIPLGSNIGPGSLGTAALCHPQSDALFRILATNCIPEELKFPNACCVGIASQTVLSIFNPTERWLQVSIGILSISVNGEKVDPAKYQCLVFKNKTIVGPHSTDDLKILFLPCHPGIFQCILSVSSWSVSADAEIVVQAEALSSRVVLTAVAENPNLEVETGKQDYLDFGDLTSGSWKALPLKIINKTHAFVPIRLIINANAVAWRCFTFSKEPVNSSNEQSLQRDAVSQAAAPSVVNHVIHASYDGQDPEVLTVWVLFHAPKKQISYTLGPAEEFLARVDVEVDSPGPSSVIQSVLLRARAGTARIHAPKDLQTIHLSAGVDSTAKQQLPLKNAGNIGVNLKLKVEQDSCFSVEPDDLFLLPGEEREVTVKFSPKNVVVLKILVLPSGPQYEVVIKGETESLENRPVPTAAADIPPILSNKQFVAWGGVKLGESVQQKLALRNNSPSVTQHLRLVIRGQDQDCFQLQSIFGSEERLTSTWELKIRPREDTNIYLMFTPTRVTSFFAKLEIKHLGIISQPGIKFTIPLSGYGGTSSVILESVKKLTDGYTLTLDGLLPSRLKRVSFRIRNTGSRAAYVKALCFANLQTKTVVDPQVMTVSPDKFILREGTHEVSIMSKLYSMMRDFEVAKPVVPENSLLRNIVFDEEFQGEKLVTEVCDIPRGTNDIRLFYANMRKIILTVVGHFVVNQDDFQQPSEHHLESNRSENAARLINATLDVLPVKGPQGPPLHEKINDGVQNKVDAEQTWSVKPEELTLLPPSISGTADTGHVEIVNSSSRMLTFELSWPAHCLTITPQHGVIEPESRALILVSPNPSLATKPSVIPWSGLIYVHCDKEQKFIKVQIREAQDASGTSSPPRRRDLFTLQSASPAVHVAKPLSAHPLTKMEIKNRTIIFPKTRAGECTESYLEMENKGDENVRWNLSSFTPPYVKAMDETGSVYRATYSAFRCYRISGTLEAHGKEKVAFMFLPIENGDYSQFWDLECHPVENPSWKHKLRFQLSGETGTEAENTSAVMRATVCSEAYTTKAYVWARTEIRLYAFLPTRVGESRTLKVNLRNNSFRTQMLKFSIPREPFYIKHTRYSLRSRHYINVPVRFRPQAEGIFESILVVYTSKYGNINIRLCGRAIARE
uniref:Centrosomal protein 192 n=1 Tax=Coturnix japonica TaxID=93934 RepID=A0A8C2T8Z7_COTJA